MVTVNSLVAILAIAGTVEVLIEMLKAGLDPLWDWLGVPDTVNPYLYISMILGVAAAAIYGFDLLAALEIVPWTYFGMISTGLVIGRGANAVHDWLARLGQGGNGHVSQ